MTSAYVNAPVVEVVAELKQFLKAAQFTYKQIRLSAELKSSMLGWATLWVTTYTSDGKPIRHMLSDAIMNKPIRDTTDWTLHECPIPVGAQSDLLSLAVVSVGTGRLWMRNVRVQMEPYDPADDEMLKSEDVVSQVASPSNLDFSAMNGEAQIDDAQLLEDWHVRYDHEYKIAAAPDVTGSGTPGVVIETLVEEPAQYSNAILRQDLKPENYLGKRLRFSAKIKSSEVAWAAVWLRARRKGRYEYDVGFKYLHAAPITGSTVWHRHDCVVDVPNDCVNIFYGVVVRGPGKVWVSEANLEEVSTNVPTNDVKIIAPEKRVPENLNFED